MCLKLNKIFQPRPQQCYIEKKYVKELINSSPGAVPQHNACSFCSSRTLLVSRTTVTPESFSAFWCSVLVFYISPVFMYKQLVIQLTAGQMENFTLMAFRLIFFWLLQLSKILPSLSLILILNSKVLNWIGGDSVLPA